MRNTTQLFKMLLVLVIIFSLNACNKKSNTTEAPYLTISNDTINISAKEATISFTIKSNTLWKIEKPTNINWVNVSKMEGKENATITIHIDSNTATTNRLSELKITYSTHAITVLILQEGKSNTPTPIPTPTNTIGPMLIISPLNGAQNINIKADFKWFKPTGIDATNNIKYAIWITTDTLSPTITQKYENITDTVFTLNNQLFFNTLYYWKVIAEDAFGNKSESHYSTFKTVNNNKTQYSDGEYAIVFEGTEAKKIPLVFTGDGYTSAELNYGGKFDQDIEIAVNAIFSVEPYKTYKNYFIVYKIAAISQASGITEGTTNIRNTAFSTKCTDPITPNPFIIQIPSPAMSGNDDKVFEYAVKIPEVKNFGPLIVMVAANIDRYAGTCFNHINKTIANKVYTNAGVAYVAVSKKDYSVYQPIYTLFENVAIHEMGGHAFGRLADEYFNNPSPIPSDKISEIQTWQKFDYFFNITTKKKTFFDLPYWDYFISKQGYESVGMYEGGYNYAQGVYRSEDITCMVNNVKYFNVAGRLLIVERIKKLVGETFDVDDFVGKDVQKSLPTVSSPTNPLRGNFPSANNNISGIVPYLSPPVMVKD